MSIKKTILTLMKNKLQNIKSVGITAYDYPIAKIVDPIVDYIIVGDTVGSTTHGIHDLNKVTMDMMISHCKAVSRGSSKSFLIGDMPFMSYQSENKTAIENASRFIESGMDAVKVEGFFPERVNSIDSSGILVMSHLGLTPQTRARFGGYRIQSKTAEETEKLLHQAKELEKAGSKLLLLEAVPDYVGGLISKELSIPVFGIGAGNKVDGQLVISHDMLGMFWEFKPKFVKRYANCENVISEAVSNYRDEVKNGNFPSREYFYDMKPEEVEKLLSSKVWKYDT